MDQSANDPARAPAPSPRGKAIITLLTINAVLLACLNGGLFFAGIVAWHQYAEFRRAIKVEVGSVAGTWRELRASALEAVREGQQRQQGLTTALDRRSQTTLAALSRLQAHRRALSTIPADPLGKLDQVIRLNQLMSDELLLLVDHLAESQTDLARNLRPLPVERRGSEGKKTEPVR